MNNPKTYWFKRRRYGWGWTPVSWQGWLAITLWLALVFLGLPAFMDAPEETQRLETAIYLMVVALATISLISLGYARGPKPKWRWGKSPGDDPKEDI